jgi:peptidoglycan hydrolase-like protein with peptidoglycan-binding domain
MLDGEYGPETKAAVAQFQTGTGGKLAIDGIAGPLTTTAMWGEP